MSEEENLTFKLNKLEIATGSELTKGNVAETPIAQNPFFAGNVNGQSSSCSKPYGGGLSSKFVASRSHRFRRCSESVIDELKDPDEPTTSCQETKNLSIKQTISPIDIVCKHCIRKPVTCDPMRRSYLNAKRERSRMRRRLMLARYDAAHSQSSSNANADPQKIVNSRNIPQRVVRDDYQGLVEECCTMLTNKVDFKDGIYISNYRCENYKLERSGPQMPHYGRYIDNAQRASLTALQEAYKCRQSTAALMNALTMMTTIRLKSRNTNANPNANSNTSEQIPNSRAGTSRSRRASNKSKNDDVTINELASYFDDYVHIPKKMSTMAEMMYI